MITSKKDNIRICNRTKHDDAAEILVIGKNSYLGKTFLTLTDHAVVSKRYFDESAINWGKIKVVINFTLNPFYKTNSYSPEIDEDLKVIKSAKKYNVHYVMLSSRMVYSPNSTAHYSEQSALGRNNVYATNKIITENIVMENLPDKQTILRLGNIFGFELDRPSFFGMALTNLKKKKEIVMDCSLSTKRDFLPVEVFCKLLDQIIITRPVGIFNLSSGLSIPVGDMGSAILSGFGVGSITSNNREVRDPFILEVKKLQNLLDFKITQEDVLGAAHKAGELLKNA